MADQTIVHSALSDDLNILIVSSNNDLVTKFRQILFTTWKTQQKDRCYDCKVHITTNLSLLHGETEAPVTIFDYFVFIIEPKFINCLKEVEDNLAYFGNKYGRQRICLVAVGANYNAAVKPKELWAFAQIYQFNLLFGEIKNADKAEYLCGRLLNLCEASCGLINGIPLIGKI